jgi:hypothetical protein
MKAHHVINYLEFPARNLEATKAFFNQAFGWEFTDYGPDYTAFSEGSVDGGFYRAEQSSSTEKAGAALVVFYSNNLEATQAVIETAGGNIIKPIFAFPGGRRFHFCEPSGNEFAVWSDVQA